MRGLSGKGSTTNGVVQLHLAAEHTAPASKRDYQVRHFSSSAVTSSVRMRQWPSAGKVTAEEVNMTDAGCIEKLIHVVVISVKCKHCNTFQPTEHGSPKDKVGRQDPLRRS